MSLRAILGASSNDEIAQLVVRSYEEIVKHYVLQNWKTAGLDAGHFVEAVRRHVEIILFGQTQPVGKNLSNFNTAVLSQYENASGNDSLRILIPRILYGMAVIRNKRGIGHLSTQLANKADASLLLHNAQWVVVELVNIQGSASSAYTESVVEAILKRQIDIVWQQGAIVRVLKTDFTAREKTLVLLRLTGTESSELLRSRVEYKNKSNYVRLLQRLHDEKFIEFDGASATISPTGSLIAENLISKSGQ